MRRKAQYEYESYNNYGYSKRRNYNKRIINVSKTVSTTQQSTVLSSCGSNAAAFTFKMSSLSLSGVCINSTGTSVTRWAVIIVRDGTTESTISTTDGQSIYEPEQNVLACGVFALDDTAGPKEYNETFYVKPSRKLQEGDEIRFIALDVGTPGVSLRAEVTFVELYG